MYRGENILIVEGSAAKITKFVEKASVHINRNSSAFFDVIKSPPTSEIAERTKKQQLHRRYRLVVILWATPPGKPIIFLDLFHKLKKCIVWEMECTLNLL